MHSESTGSSSKSASAANTLQRGQACVNCRRRKMKCDGNKPVCGQCVRSHRPDDCEYTDGQGRSRTQILEENISRLEARIHELEHPDESGQSITLHNPYQTRGHSGRGEKASLSSRSPASGTSFHGSSLDERLIYYSPGSKSHPAAFGDALWTSDEPPVQIVQILVDSFLPHAASFGFFLDLARFRNSTLLGLPFGHAYRPAPALLSVIYLWGIHLHILRPRTQSLTVTRDHEKLLLSRSLQQTASALSGSHPQRILHTIQAEVLLTYYFFANGKFLEGQYHSSAAVSLALSSGLDRIRSPAPRNSAGDMEVRQILPPAHDQIAEGERISCFWNVAVLDLCWATSLNSPPNIPCPDDMSGSQIDTPWPLTMAEYTQGLLPPGLRSRATMLRFVTGAVSGTNINPGDTYGFSGLAMHAKAAILFIRSSKIAGKWRQTLPPADKAAFSAEFTACNALIDNFVRTLHVVAHDQHALATCTLAHVSTIQLNKLFAHGSERSRQKCLDAARAVVTLVVGAGNGRGAQLDPIMGTLWTSTCQVVLDEVARLRAHRSATAPHVPAAGEAELVAHLRAGLAAMATFAVDGPLIKYQLGKMQEAYASM